MKKDTSDETRGMYLSDKGIFDVFVKKFVYLGPIQCQEQYFTKNVDQVFSFNCYLR